MSACAVALALALVPARAATHAVVVGMDGAVARMSMDEAASPERHVGASHLWVWSEELPPTVVQTTELSHELRVEVEHLAVTLPPLRQEEKRARYVLAGPVALWAEVPESLLPRWEVPASGRLELPRRAREGWRVRALGQNKGTPWVDVTPSQKLVTLAEVDAVDVVVSLRASDGKPPLGSTVRVLSGLGTQKAGAEMRAWEQGNAAGRVRFDSVPRGERLALLVMAAGFQPLVAQGRAEQVSGQVELLRGLTAQGVFVDGKRQPVAGVKVAAEHWAASDVPFLMVRSATTGADGSWSISGLPAGEVFLQATASGYATWHTVASLGEPGLDVGTVVLPPAASVVIDVRNDVDEPVPGAEVFRGGDRLATADARGKAVVTGLSPGERVNVRIVAAEHLPAVLSVAPATEQTAPPRGGS